jgi:hypothetical protein
VPDLFASAGALRPAYDAVDWAETPLGPVESWSPALRNAVDIALNTGFPITLLWGPDAVLLYNESYVPILDRKHPWALGRPAREVFPEAWDLVGGLHRRVMEDDEPVYIEDALVPLVRKGQLSEEYYTFAYSPVHGADGRVEGVMDIVATTTGQVTDGRRLRLLTELRAALASVEHTEDVVARALEVIGDDRADVVAAEVTTLPAGETLTIGDDGATRLAVPFAAAGVGAGYALAFTLNPLIIPDEQYVGFLRLLVRTVDQALDRVYAVETERSLSTALQRSLLTRPASSAAAQVAVRYQPASVLAQVGGDWYDSFRLPDGSLALVVGDVAGHDQDAAALMGQLRNLARGVAYAVPPSPAAILAAVDRAVLGLELGIVATAVLVRYDEATGVAQWASAGHPPAVVIGPDGSARLLEAKPDLLLGVDPDLDRHDHELVLPPGSTLVLYSDGLVERRRVPLHDSLEWLRATLDGRQDVGAEDLCSFVLEAAQAVEDDVALLVLRVHHSEGFPGSADPATGADMGA